MVKCILVFLMAIAYASSLTFTDQDGTLTCDTNKLTINLNLTKAQEHGRDFVFKFDGSSDPACSVDSSAGAEGSLVLTSSYNDCGIEVSAEGDTVKYSQKVQVIYGQNPASSLVYRAEKALTFEIECVKTAGNVVALAGAGHVNVSSLEEQTVSKSEEGTFDIELIRTTDGSYATQDESSQMKLGDNMYFKLALNTIRDDLKIAPQTCYATNAKDSTEKYNLIENGCPNEGDGTVKVTENEDMTVFEWENQAFKFFGESDAVYVTCDVTVCEDGNDSPACSRCGAGPEPPRKRRAIAAGSVRRSRISTMTFTLV